MKEKKILQDLKIPEDMQEKLKELKVKVEKFKDKLLKEYKKDVFGVELLPPAKGEQDKDKINVLVLTHTDDIKKEVSLKTSLQKAADKIAQEIDKKIMPEVMLLIELKEACFDAKYEILEMVALGAILYDPFVLLGGLKVSEIHKGMVLKKFEKYIVSYVVGGSLFRLEKSHDIDAYVIIDDTDVKRMSRFELREKLRSIIVSLSFDAEQISGVKKLFHVQIYILTDFWESVKDAHPVIFTFLRDGVPLFDRGVFTPWKLLLKMGRIRPSPEAIDMHMDLGERLIDRAKKKLLGIAAEDLFYSVMNPTQAALMLYGVSPPTPKETVKLSEEIFVKKEKLLEKKYVNILEEIRALFKKIEHGKVKEITGTQIDKYIKKAEMYLKRIQKLFNQIEKKKEAESIVDICNGCIKAAKDVLKSANVKFKDSTLEKDLAKYANKVNMPEKIVNVLNTIKKAKKEYQQRKLSKVEAEKTKREARVFIRAMVEHIQRKKTYEIERSKIRFKYGNKYGEMILSDNNVFIISDIDSKDKQIQRATVGPDGSLLEIKKSNIPEFEEFLSKVKVQPQVLIKEKVFEEIKKLYGKDVEILLNY